MNQKTNMDEQILRLMDEHPSEGISLLMDQYMGLLWSACRLCLNDPEDIRECVQDTIADFYAARERFCLEKGTLKSYLYVIARRKAAQAARENERYRGCFLDREPADEKDAIEQLLDRTMLEQALSKLREQDSRMIRMRYYDGMTCKEIACSMNLPLDPDMEHRRTAGKMSTAQGEGVPSILKQTYFVPEARDQYTFLVFDEICTFQMKPIGIYEDFSGVGISQTHSGRTIVLRTEWTDGRLLADAYTYSEDAWKIIQLGTKLPADWQSDRLIDEPVFHYETEDMGDRPYALSIDSEVLRFTGNIPVLKIPVPDTSRSLDLPFQAGEDHYRITKVTRSRGTYEYFRMEEDGTETVLYGDELLFEIEPVELEANTRLMGFLGDMGTMREQKRYRMNQETGKLEEIGRMEHFERRWTAWGSRPGWTFSIPVGDPEELPEEVYLHITDLYKYWDQEFSFEIF